HRARQRRGHRDPRPAAIARPELHQLAGAHGRRSVDGASPARPVPRGPAGVRARRDDVGLRGLLTVPEHPAWQHPHAALFAPVRTRSRRAAPWDRSGGNDDLRHIEPGDTQTLLDVEGPGCITKLYCATGPMPLTYLRDMILRAYWDGEEQPSLEAPLGDLF